MGERRPRRFGARRRGADASRTVAGGLSLVLYDLDGTLVDAFEDIAAALNHGLREAGLDEQPIERVRAWVGDGILRLVERAAGPGNRNRAREIVPAVRAYYNAHATRTARLYPGVKATLRRLRVSGLRQAILTNKPHDVALTSCDRLGLTPLVDAIQGETSGAPLKPDPRSARRLIRRLKATPAGTVMVGDGPADLALAKAAGIAMIGCAWGTTPRQRLLAAGCDVVIEAIEELPGALERLRDRTPPPRSRPLR